MSMPQSNPVFAGCFVAIFILLPVARAAADEQGPPPHGPPPGGQPGSQRVEDPLSDLSGKWWTNPATVRRLALTEEQQKRIDQIFQQSRLRLIDLRAGLEKEEALLDPLLAADHPQDTLVLPQIDRVAAARAELERANARMLFSFRQVLTSEQWKQLKSPPAGPGNMTRPRKR
jgi:protein CpxP